MNTEILEKATQPIQATENTEATEDTGTTSNSVQKVVLAYQQQLQEIANLKQQIAHLKQSQLSEEKLKSALKLLNEKYKTALAQLEALPDTSEIDTLKDQLTSEKELSESQKLQLQEIKNELEKQRKTVETAESQYHKLHAEWKNQRYQLEQQLVQAQQKQDLSFENNPQTEIRNKEFKEQLHQIEQRLREKEIAYHTLEKQYRESQDELQKLSEWMKKKNQAEKEYNRQFKLHEQVQLELQQAKVLMLKGLNDVRSLEERFSGALQEKAAYIKRNQVLQQKVDELTLGVQHYKQQLQSAYSNHTKIKAEQTQLENSLQSLEQEKELFSHERLELQKRLVEEETTKSILEHQLQALTADLERAKNRLEHLPDVEALHARSQDQQTAFAILQNKYEEQRFLAHQLQMEADELKNKSENQVRDNERSQKTLQQLVSQLQEKDTQIQYLQQQAHKKNKEFTHASEQLELLKRDQEKVKLQMQQTQSLQEQLSLVCQQNHEWENRCQTLDQQRKRLAERLNGLETLEKDYQNLQQALTSIKPFLSPGLLNQGGQMLGGQMVDAAHAHLTPSTRMHASQSPAAQSPLDYLAQDLFSQDSAPEHHTRQSLFD